MRRGPYRRTREPDDAAHVHYRGRRSKTWGCWETLSGSEKDWAVNNKKILQFSQDLQTGPNTVTPSIYTNRFRGMMQQR